MKNKSADITEDDLEKSLQDLERLAKSGADSEVEEEEEAEEEESEEGALSKSTKDEEAEEEESEADESEEEEEEEETEKSHGKAGRLKRKKAAEDDEDGEEETEKSLHAASMEKDETVEKAVEVSDFLKSFVGAMGAEIDMIDARLEKSFGEQNGTNVLLIKALGNLSKQVSAIAEKVGAISDAPAAAPKSVRAGGVKVLEKGLGKGAAPTVTDPNDLRKSILVALEGLVKKGEVPASSLIKFESTNEISVEDRQRALMALGVK